jgi:hypothetical protein
MPLLASLTSRGNGGKSWEPCHQPSLFRRPIESVVSCPCSRTCPVSRGCPDCTPLRRSAGSRPDASRYVGSATGRDKRRGLGKATLESGCEPLLGAGKWGAGPTFVVLEQSGGWTYGALANHLWSYAGDDFTGGAARSDVNSTFIQPFLSYTTSTAVTYGVNLEASANWEAMDDDEWTVPMHLTVTKLTKFGPFPMNIGGGSAFLLPHLEGDPIGA